MAVILHIETATQACSVALSESGKLLGIRESHEKNIHSSVVTVFIDALMKEAGLAFGALDAVAVSMGPGSYTGLRIGVSTAKGICFAIEKPLIAIGTLEAMAAGMLNEMTSQLNSRRSRKISDSQSEMTSRSTLLCPMIDARRMEVYDGLFDINLQPQREITAEIITEKSFAGSLENHIIYFAGDGAEKCRPILGHHPNTRFIEDFYPSALFMIKIAEEKFNERRFENVAYFEPFYLKDFIPGTPHVKGLRFEV